MSSRSVRITTAITSSVTGPRARASAITAIVTVGEKLMTSAAVRSAAASRSAPAAVSPSGSIGHSSHSSRVSAARAPSITVPPIISTARHCALSAVRFSSRPATSAISARAKPLTTWRSRAIGAVMRLSR